MAVPGTAQAFLVDHIKALSEKFDIYLVADFSSQPDFMLEGLKGIHHVPINRSIHPLKDIKATVELATYFNKMKFDAVHSVTPKAGFTTAIAAKIAKIPHRIHIFTGQVWATRTGIMRSLLKFLDKIIAELNNHILVDGRSQRQFLISEGVVTEAKSSVLGAGSICGANVEKFVPSERIRNYVRVELGISSDKIVYCFLGRHNREKGVLELFEAFNKLAAEANDAYLLLIGSDEDNCIAQASSLKNIKPHENFLYYGTTPEPEKMLQAADIFCLPSYREGFGMSVVEASCLGIPVICSDAYGLADTMADNVTGIRCKVADVDSLYKAMLKLYNEPELRSELGKNGRERTLKLFPGNVIVGEWVKFYRTLFS